MKKQSGFTILEFMISSVIGLLLLASIMGLLVNSRQTSRVQSGLSKIQETGKLALFFIEKDTRESDYWGCLDKGLEDINNVLDSSDGAYNPSLHSFNTGVDGTNGTINMTNRGEDQPDSLILNGVAGNSSVFVQPPFGPQSSANLKTSANTFSKGDILFVGDCSKGDIFQVTNANPTIGTIVHNTGNAVSPGNKATPGLNCTGGNQHCFSKVYEGDAMVYLLTQNSFTIENDSSGNPALFKNGTILLSGVTNMQILFGEDTDNNGTVNYYVERGNVIDIKDVIALKIELLIVSDKYLAFSGKSINYNGGNIVIPDKRIGKVFSTTISLRNRLK